MADQKSLEVQEKKLSDEELEEVAGGVLGVGNPLPRHHQESSTSPPPAPRPRRDL